jgi:hypothetical protein
METESPPTRDQINVITPEDTPVKAVLTDEQVKEEYILIGETACQEYREKRFLTEEEVVALEEKTDDPALREFQIYRTLAQIRKSQDPRVPEEDRKRYENASFNPKTREYRFLNNKNELVEGKGENTDIFALSDKFVQESTASDKTKDQIRSHKKDLQDHTEVTVIQNGEEKKMTMSDYLAIEEEQRPEIKSTQLVGRKSDAPPTAEPDAAESTEQLNPQVLQKIYEHCDKSGLPRPYADELFPLLGRIKTEEDLVKILPKIRELGKKYNIKPENLQKFVQDVYPEFTGEPTPANIKKPETLFQAMLENQRAQNMINELFPYDPGLLDQLRAAKDKKGIQIALGILSKGKPDLYKMVLIMTLFQMYEQSQERQ